MIDVILNAMTDHFQTVESIAQAVEIRERTMAWKTAIVVQTLLEAQALGKVQSRPSGSRETEYKNMWRKKS